MQRVVTGKVEPSETCTTAQLDSSRQLNQGGSHLGTHHLHGSKYRTSQNSEKIKKCTVFTQCLFFFLFTVDASVKDPKTQQSGKDSQLSHSLLSDIKKAIGAEKTNQLFVALQTYKKTNDYEQMVSTVVGLLTERDEDIILLKRESLSLRE